MRKEQTPITAEGFYKNHDFAPLPFTGNTIEIDDVELFEIMEQYAQSKVLEALERETKEAFKKGFKESTIRYNGETTKPILSDYLHYYETEVKPKYVY